MRLGRLMEGLREKHGYGIMKREDNPYCGHCTEIVLGKGKGKGKGMSKGKGQNV